MFLESILVFKIWKHHNLDFKALNCDKALSSIIKDIQHVVEDNLKLSEIWSKVKWKIKYGSLTFFWEDLRFGENLLSVRFPHLYRICTNKYCSVKHFLEWWNNTSDHVSQSWTRTFGAWEEENVAQLEEIIDSISRLEGDDNLLVNFNYQKLSMIKDCYVHFLIKIIIIIKYGRVFRVRWFLREFFCFYEKGIMVSFHLMLFFIIGYIITFIMIFVVGVDVNRKQFNISSWSLNWPYEGSLMLKTGGKWMFYQLFKINSLWLIFLASLSKVSMSILGRW